MDVLKYPKQKTKGSVTLAKYGDSFKITARAFDQETGEETLPTEGVVTREQMQKERDICVQRVAAFDALLADMDALNSK